MRDIFEAIYGSIVVNHASLPVKGKGFSVLAATGLEKATGEIYRTLSRNQWIRAIKNRSEVQQCAIDLGTSDPMAERISPIYTKNFGNIIMNYE